MYSYQYPNGQNKVDPVLSRLAVGVFDDDKYTPLNRGESACGVEWFKNHGATVIMPPNEKGECDP